LQLLKDSGKYNFRKNYYLAILNGIFYNISYAFMGGTTVLPLFISTITNSRIFVGLVTTIETASWPLPQIFAASMVEHKKTKKSLYIVMAVLRSISLLMIFLFIVIFAKIEKSLFLGCFIILFSVYSLAGGISGIPFMDIIGKIFPSHKRGTLWAWRMSIGGSFGVLAGFVVRYIIKKIEYPLNFGILFLIATFFISLGFIAFSLMNEPISKGESGERKKFTVFIGQGIKSLKKDNNFKNLFFLRIFLGINAMAIPFYILFIKEQQPFEISSVGLFVSAQTFGAIISNLLWGNLSKYKGNHSVLRVTAIISILPPSLIMISHFFPPNLCFALVIFIFLGITIQGTWLGFPNALLDIAPDKKRPTYVGFMNTMIAPALFLPIVGGILIDKYSFYIVFIISFLASIFAFFFSMKFNTERGNI